MSFNFSEVSRFSASGMKAKPKGNGEEVAITKETISLLEKKVLPFGKLGMKFRTIDVFWHRMWHKESQAEIRPAAEEEDSSTKKQGTLTAARPPDGVVVPIWRKCHMGILLQAFKDDDKEAGLTVAIHLHDDGIRMAYDFGTAPQEEVVEMLRPGENRAIYSAGVMRDIDVEVKQLLDFVETFKTAGYHLITFNCQHFSTMLYLHFTRQLLSENLRRRWTSNKDVFGKSLNNDEQKMKLMQWASASQLLMEEWEPVEGEPFLFCRSPPPVGRLVKGVTVVGAVVAPRFPLAGVAMIAGATLLDKVTSVTVRRFKRSVIWFKYCDDKMNGIGRLTGIKSMIIAGSPFTSFRYLEVNMKGKCFKERVPGLLVFWQTTRSTH